VRLTRRHGWFFAAVTVWNVLTWSMFARNLAEAHAAGEDRPQGYWIAHTALIVVNLALAVVFGRLAWRTLRSSDA
jgi:hypothetical protein